MNPLKILTLTSALAAVAAPAHADTITQGSTLAAGATASLVSQKDTAAWIESGGIADRNQAASSQLKTVSPRLVPVLAKQVGP